MTEQEQPGSTNLKAAKTPVVHIENSSRILREGIFCSRDLFELL